jgi:hypothetical protein
LTKGTHLHGLGKKIHCVSNPPSSKEKNPGKKTKKKQTSNKKYHIRRISTTDFGISKPWILRFKPNSAVFLLTSCDIGKVLICKID